MAKLNNAGLVEPIRQFSQSGRPLLGICLGMQLLSSEGVEGGLTAGLGVVPGKAIPIDAKPGLRIPHVGWNEAHQIRKHPILTRIRDDVDFYFVHSFRFAADNLDDVYAQTEYGGRFSSIVGRANVVGVQFHAEKSQANGLRLLDNFCAWNGRC
jgi:glutamine amidotransferase